MTDPEAVAVKISVLVEKHKFELEGDPSIPTQMFTRYEGEEWVYVGTTDVEWYISNFAGNIVRHVGPLNETAFKMLLFALENK